LARALSGTRFDRVVSSDLSRAYETACAIAGAASVRCDPRWREFAFGKWEGLTWEQIAARWPQAAQHGVTAAARYEPPDGETFEAVRTRVAEALQDLRTSDNPQVLVVTHAGPLHAMLHELFGDRAEMQLLLGIRFMPGSITRVRVEPDGAEVVALNEVGHLA
jgi:broad specificity phosphatase PhoE